MMKDQWIDTSHFRHIFLNNYFKKERQKKEKKKRTKQM